MATQKFYTQEQIEAAKIKLSELPDLSSQKVPTGEMLDFLKSEIITLANQKGYNAKEIKSALDAMEIRVSERAISDVIKSTKSTTSKRKKTPRQNESAGK